MDNKPMKEYALAYTRENGHRKAIPIFPLHGITNGVCDCGHRDCTNQGKHPLTNDGYKAAAINTALVKSWWDKYPNANIGIATGELSGLVVIDVDNHKGSGDDDLHELEARYGELPDTWEAITGSGGRHIYLHYPQGYTIPSSIGKIAPNIDVRANGGYVVAPPSMHKNGHRYEWETAHYPNDIELADIPPMWLELLSDPDATRTVDGQFALPEIIEVGARNETLMKYGASLRARKVPALKIHALMQTANVERCSDPLPEQEVDKIFNSVTKYAEGKSESYIVTAAQLESKRAENEERRDARIAALDTGATKHDGDGTMAATPIPDTDDDSQVATMQRFDHLYHDILKWNSGWGWVYWDGAIWRRKAEADALSLYFSMTNEYRLQAQQLDPNDPFRKYVKSMRTTNYGKNVLEGLHGDMRLATDAFDADPAALNTPGGIVDLRTGELHPLSARAYCTHATSCTPGTKGTDEWNEFLRWVTGGDTALQRYIKQVAGMAAYGKLMHEGIIIAHGSGGNGKSTLFNAIQTVLNISENGYAGSVSPDILMSSRGQDRANALSALFGKRFVIAAETEEGNRLDGSVVKRLASTDPIHARYLYLDGFDYVPTHTLLLYTNHLPRVGSMDEGMWRRLTVIPFKAKQPPEKTVLNYGAHLAEECGEAVLQWIVDGAKEFIGKGFKLDVPQCVREYTNEYRGAQNTIQNFIDECCDVDDEYKNEKKVYSSLTTTASTLQLAYRTWAELNGEWEGRKGQELAAALQAMGFERKHTMNGNIWNGLRIKEKGMSI